VPPRTVALIAGASGSGKSRLAHLCGLPVLRLDNFYRNETAPNMPRSANGLIDWDDIQAWDADAAATALATLARTGTVTAPVYDISRNAAVNTITVDATAATAIAAEGIFATHMLDACEARGLPTVAIWLDRGRWVTWWRRLQRDVRQHRKPLGVLWRRGLVLCRAEPALRQAAIAAGFQPMTMRRAQALLRQIL